MYVEEVRAERDKRRGAQDPRTNCQADSSSQTPGSCNTCGVTIGETIYCSKCNVEATYAPVNGQCVDVTKDGSEKTLCPAKGQGKCTQCGGNSLLYMGGCYEASEGKPGYNLCTLASNGVCTEAAPGYFLNPLKANDKDSVVACSSTTGFVEADKTYKGVQYCETCDGSALTDAQGGTAKCTKCGNSKDLKVSGDTTDCLENAAACGTGYAAKKDSKNGNRCVSCKDQTEGVTDCETCEYNTGASKIKCTKCTDPKYLKTVSGVTTCETNCGEGYFKKDNGGASNSLKVCSPCAANCLTCMNEAADKCKSCTADTHFLVVVADGAGKCVSCGDETSGVPNCAKGTLSSGATKPTCSECSPGFTVSEDKTKCTSSGATRSGLSTGAIAGISVAAVVVVGGLVGFLCWWFVCRGKA